MASYYPPTKNTAIFDSALFSQGDEGLTKAEADKAYVKYPTAQGAITTPGLTVNGPANLAGTNIVTGPTTMSNTTTLSGTTNKSGTSTLSDPTIVSGATTLSGNTTATKRVNQVLNATTGFESVNGYYGLAKNAQPLVTPTTSVRAIQPMNIISTPANTPINYEFMCWSPEASVFVSSARSGGSTNTQIITSPDGKNWFFSPYTATTNIGWTGAYYGSGKIIIFSGGTEANTQKIMYSTDAVTWNLASTPTLSGKTF
jgi:hypothetical protein